MFLNGEAVGLNLCEELTHYWLNLALSVKPLFFTSWVGMVWPWKVNSPLLHQGLSHRYRNQNISLNLGHNIQKPMSVSCHCEECHEDVQYFGGLTPSADKFLSEQNLEHPRTKIVWNKKWTSYIWPDPGEPMKWQLDQLPTFKHTLETWLYMHFKDPNKQVVLTRLTVLCFQ